MQGCFKVVRFTEVKPLLDCRRLLSLIKINSPSAEFQSTFPEILRTQSINPCNQAS